MNSIHMTAGFITPEKKIDIGNEHLLAFCGLACQKYLKDHPDEIEAWKNFSKDYSYFHPFFDFLVFYLKWIPVGILGDSNTFGILEEDRLYIQELPNLPEEEDLYNTLFYAQIKNPNSKKYLVKADNLTLNIHSPKKRLHGEGIVLQDGFVFIQNNISQFALVATIMNQLIIKYPFLIEDFDTCKEIYKDDYHWYFVDRLGSILFTEKYAIYDHELVSPKQQIALKNIPGDVVEQDKTEEDYQNPYSLESTKNFISKIYNT